MGRWFNDVEVVRVYKKVELRLYQNVPLCSVLRNLDLSNNRYNSIKKRAKRILGVTDTPQTKGV